MSYFNTDWLSDDRLSISEGVKLDEFGNPIDTPDLENIMKDHLVEEGYVLDPGLSGIDEYIDEDYLAILGSDSLNLGAKYDIGGEGKEEDFITGQKLWEMSGAEGIIGRVDAYDKFNEKNRKSKAISNINQSVNKIESAQRIAGDKTVSLQQVIGKSGFAGSGNKSQMLESHYGDVSRTVKGLTGDIKTSMLGYESDVHKLRKAHIDDIWSLYGDWLDMAPETGKQVAGLSNQGAVEVAQNIWDAVGPLLPDEIMTAAGGSSDLVEQALNELAIQGGATGFDLMEQEDDWDAPNTGGQGNALVDIVDAVCASDMFGWLCD